MDVRSLLGRSYGLFASDIAANDGAIDAALANRRVLIVGGAGSIGREVTAEIFRRRPAALHVVDISENTLVELVRKVRSSDGYSDGDLRFLPLDIASVEARAFLAGQPAYDFVLNFAAMKHVRSEKDEFSLMRMIKVNVLDTLETLNFATRGDAYKYFAVSTDKAQNPANLMGATKRIMEDVIFGGAIPVSTARFANVAFSDGSLLHGFLQRMQLRQPISAPSDIRRYFVTGQEAGRLCLASIALGTNREIFFPRFDPDADLLTFADIAVRLLEANGYTPVPVDSEDEARGRAAELIAARRWPCFFFASDTSGEKPFEEFYGPADSIDWNRFTDLGVIRREAPDAAVIARANYFLATVGDLRSRGAWTNAELTTAIKIACPELDHIDTGRTLDNRM